MSELQSPQFLGKFALQSTGGDGAWVAAVCQSSGEWLVMVNATSQSDQTLWSGYAAGSGTMVLQAENGLFVTVTDQTGFVTLTASASAAQAVVFSALPSAPSASVSATCSRTYGPSTNELFYTPGEQPFAMFPLSGGSPPRTAETTLQVYLVTPSLAAMQAAKTASGYDLRGVNLRGASLAGVNCSGAQFQGALLAGANLGGANLAGAYFVGTDLRGILWGSNIQAAGANFSGAIGCGISVLSTGTSSQGPCAKFDGGNFSNADFAGASLSGASFVSALFFNANFSGANLAGSNLSGISAGVSATGALQPADFSGAFLPGSDLNEAHLEGVSFANAQMYQVLPGTLNNAFLIKTNLSGADLTGMSLNKTVIQGANFDGALLINCTFTGVTLEPAADGTPVSMAGAHLESASFSPNCSFVGARLTGAWMAASAGVPLFAVAISNAAIAALDGSVVPSSVASSFAFAGYSLRSTAVVTTVTEGSAWLLAQSPANTLIGVCEAIGFALALSGSALSVTCTSIAINELQPGDITINIPLPVSSTVLGATQLDLGTRAPNGRTMLVNSLDQLRWPAVLTALRLPTASN